MEMLKAFTNNSNKIETITTLEIAEMMEVQHKIVLRKLDGDKNSKGIIQILTKHNLVLSDYFIESTYTDNSGKQNKCYLVTKLGCDFLANKFTGEKGVLFTAKYVKRFHEMDKLIKEDKQETTIIGNVDDLSPELQIMTGILNTLANQQREQRKLTEKQNEIIQTVSKFEDDVQEIKAKLTTSDENYYTVSGYIKLNKIKIGFEKTKDIGKIASKLSRENDYPIEKVKSERFGHVNCYHKDILKMAFNEYAGRELFGQMVLQGI